MINEIQKLMFDRHFYARFLSAHQFDTSKAIDLLKNYLAWRKNNNIDTILVSLRIWGAELGKKGER